MQYREIGAKVKEGNEGEEKERGTEVVKGE